MALLGSSSCVVLFVLFFMASLALVLSTDSEDPSCSTPPFRPRTFTIEYVGCNTTLRERRRRTFKQPQQFSWFLFSTWSLLSSVSC
ncbi:hypothetical protein Q7C36_013955 [Tachysurus vachellii]|uniref:Secreted protein n=1 Tax=Tachysurus vachellii TaxID=175792 RepID=A0AA88MM89_TACVA|nr:hypothetical protein Q7C36_013955 [Tachysurus vachellii]